MDQSKSPNSLSLLHLPTEVLRQIFSSIQPPSAHTIRPILLTCKYFHTVALPLSVSTVRFVSNGYDERSIAGSDRRLFKFMRYIAFTHPDLARHVRRLIVDSFETRESANTHKTRKATYFSQEIPGGSPKNERDVYQGLIHGLIAPESTDQWKEWRQDWLTDLDDGIPDAQVALLLTVCKGLTDFSLGEPFRPRLVLRVIGIAAREMLSGGNHEREAQPASIDNTSLPLQQVRELFQESTEGKYGYLVFEEMSAPFFRLPNMRTWECILANAEGNDDFKFWSLPRGSSGVESVILRKSAITPQVLHAITGACRALRSLEYTFGVYHMYGGAILPGNVMDAILPHASSLHSLYINFQEDWDNVFWEDDPSKLYMGADLRKMTALESLTASMQALTGLLDRQPVMQFGADLPLSMDDAPRLVDCLPKQSLEHLEIHNCGRAILGQAQEFLDTLGGCKPRFSRLKQVRFLFDEESITPDEITLSSPSEAVTLEVVVRSAENRRFDFGGKYQLPGTNSYVHNMCTKLYDSTFQSRELWLATRGGTRGKADDNEIVRAP